VSAFVENKSNLKSKQKNILTIQYLLSVRRRKNASFVFEWVALRWGEAGQHGRAAYTSSEQQPPTKASPFRGNTPQTCSWDHVATQRKNRRLWRTQHTRVPVLVMPRIRRCSCGQQSARIREARAVRRELWTTVHTINQNLGLNSTELQNHRSQSKTPISG